MGKAEIEYQKRDKAADALLTKQDENNANGRNESHESLSSLPRLGLG